MVVVLLGIKEIVLGEWCVVLMLEIVCRFGVLGIVVWYEVGVGLVVGFIDVVYDDVGVCVFDVGCWVEIDILLCV